MKSCHASSARTSAWRKNISDSDILNEFGVKLGLCVSRTKDMREDKFWLGVLETALSALSSSSSDIGLECYDANDELL